jgi:predicted nucleic acid-binding protein
VVVVDTSAWIEYFRDGEPSVVRRVERCLDQDLVALGDLIYCEVMQGVRLPRQRREISSLFLSLPHFEMVGFPIAERAAHNYRLLRSCGVTVRKTLDVLIGTFCVENGLPIIHYDRDFDLMAKHIGLAIWKQ